MFCPQCKAEYRAGFIRCSDCDVELVSQLPVDPIPVDPARSLVDHLELVVVRTYTNQFDADVARSALEAAGIEPVLRGEWSTRGVDILVRSEDAKDADDILGSELSS